MIEALIFRDLLGRSDCDDVAARVSAFGPEVDDPVRGFDDIQIVLDDQHRTSRLDQTFESDKQLIDVVKV